jgi:F0F1-type ATP synthase delta subunit
MKYSPRQYALSLYELLNEHPHGHKKVIHEFAQLLLKNNSLKLFPEISAQFKEVVNEKENLVEANVITAKEKPHLPHTIQHKKLHSEITQDPKIKAGIKIKLGDTVIENTLEQRFRKLKTLIGQHNG